MWVGEARTGSTYRRDSSDRAPNTSHRRSRLLILVATRKRGAVHAIAGASPRTDGVPLRRCPWNAYIRLVGARGIAAARLARAGSRDRHGLRGGSDSARVSESAPALAGLEDSDRPAA